MATVEIVVNDLSFPANLEDKYCRFRPLISLRYKDSNGTTSYAREALPGLGPRDFWECEKKNKNQDGYVRHATEPKVDMDKLDVTQRQITFSDLDIKTLERVEVELFDIDTKPGWQKILGAALSMVPPEALPHIDNAMPLSLTLIKGAIEMGTGKTIPDLEKALINKAIGRDDGAARSIWVRSQDLTNPPQSTLTITGPGSKGTGNYSMTLQLDVS